LYELRFSPMCKPAAEVANLTQLESHTTRSRLMMLWRVAAGHLEWGAREAELLYESTLDSISEAFDVFHYPVSQYMLDARADVWEADLAPVVVQEVVESSKEYAALLPSPSAFDGAILLAGEIAQLDKPERYLDIQKEVLVRAQISAGILAAQSGALAFVLGAREVALMQAGNIVEKISNLKGDLDLIIADGPETAWALQVVYPQLGIHLDERIGVRTLSSLLAETYDLRIDIAEKVFYHDSRAAYLIAEKQPGHLAVLPGYTEDEAANGTGEVYEAPRRLLERLGVEQVFGNWTRGLAKSCGADDGLWKTFPHLAAGLARQRLDYAAALGAGLIVCDSPLCAAFLDNQLKPGDPEVYWLPELLLPERIT
jgi:hypothetical protein